MFVFSAVVRELGWGLWVGLRTQYYFSHLKYWETGSRYPIFSLSDLF
jgi:hypothetical protein